MAAGFLTVLSVAEVTVRLSALTGSKPVETVSLAEAEGRILACDVISSCDVPPANRAGMDGYALLAQDSFGAGESNPVWLDQVGEVAIDAPANFTVGHGQCAQVVTGAHMPPGADAVVMVEHTRIFGEDVVEVRRSVAPGEYVMCRGEDATTGQCALAAGTLLRAQEIGLLAAIGHCEVPVYCQPVAHILSTGDELVPARELPALGQIRDVNSHALACMVRQAGAKAIQRGIVRDELGDLRAALHASLREAPEVIFLSGGSSVGVRDLTLDALTSLNQIMDKNSEGTKYTTEIICHGVALSPGKPLILALVHSHSAHGAPRQTVVWGLPGQVASAQVVMMVLGAPFLRSLAGHARAFDQHLWPTRRAVLSRNMASRQGREDYVRVRLEFSEYASMPQAVPVPGLSGLLRTLLGAHGLMRIPERLEGMEAGTEVEILLFAGV